MKKIPFDVRLRSINSTPDYPFALRLTVLKLPCLTPPRRPKVEKSLLDRLRVCLRAAVGVLGHSSIALLVDDRVSTDPRRALSHPLERRGKAPWGRKSESIRRIRSQQAIARSPSLELAFLPLLALKLLPSRSAGAALAAVPLTSPAPPPPRRSGALLPSLLRRRLTSESRLKLRVDRLAVMPPTFPLLVCDDWRRGGDLDRGTCVRCDL